MTTRPNDNYISIPSPGILGWVDFNEADLIEDNASPSVENVVYDGGHVAPRPGSRLFAEKPNGAGQPQQIIEAVTSDQLEYIIAVYNNNLLETPYVNKGAWVGNFIDRGAWVDRTGADAWVQPTITPGSKPEWVDFSGLNNWEDRGSFDNWTELADPATLPNWEGEAGTLEFEGETYPVVGIGGQKWTAKNLKYLPSVNEASDRSNTEARYYVYGYDGTSVTDAKNEDNYDDYGVLYNHAAFMNLSLPTNWQRPELDDFSTLAVYVGGASVAGKALKAESPDWNGDDDYGFAALPTGSLLNSGFQQLGAEGYLRTTEEPASTTAGYVGFFSPSNGMSAVSGSRADGDAVRLISFWKEGDLVQHEGVAYRCLTDDTLEEPGTGDDWEEVLGYDKDDRVVHNGAAWESDIDDNTDEPPTNWTNISYQENEQVLHNGQVWQSDTDDNIDEPPTDWTDIGYKVGDQIEHNGDIWVCKTNNTLEEPGTGNDWELGVPFYDINDVVNKNGLIYQSNQAGNTSEPPINWTDISYKLNNKVQHAGKDWYCLVNNTLQEPGESNDWQEVPVYNTNDLVTYQGEQWYSTTDNNTDEPGQSGTWQSPVTSNGVPVYDNFYLWHPEVHDWVQLNQSFEPTETNKYWGYVSWNNGRAQDYVYACNGVDNFVKWHMTATVVDGAHTTSDETITVKDATRFPDSGTVIFKSGGQEFTWEYNSKTATELVGSSPISEALADGDAVTIEMVEVPTMEKGKVLGKHGGRLFVMNRFGAEIAGFYSKLNDPEDFTSGSAIPDASSFVISDGNGEITGFEDYGRFAVIAKQDSFHTFEIVISDDLGSKLDKIQPVISGTSIGPLSQPATIKMRNRIMYPTRTEGFYSLDPISSGESTGSAIQVVSQPIQNHVTNKVAFEQARGTVYNQNAIWAVGDIDGGPNLEVLVLDTLRQAWTRFTGWAVKDWGRFNDRIFYLENQTGRVYECFTKNFDDNNSPVAVEFFTKRFNFGELARPKVTDHIYVQGYITPAAELYVDVLYNEGGLQGTQTFLIRQGKEGILVSQELTNAQGQPVQGTTATGYASGVKIEGVSFFRTYLGIDISKGYYNVQLRFHSNQPAFWAVTGVGFNPQMNIATDSKMVLSPE